MSRGSTGRVLLLLPRGPLENPNAWLPEGAEARSGADCVFAAADVVGGEVVEGEAHAFPYHFQKEQGGVREGSSDVEGGNDEVDRVSWRKMASCGNRPGIAPQRLAGMLGSRWGRMRRRRMVQIILSSVTAQTVGRQLSGLAQSPF